MAGDHFVQIANALFRDARISFKAKGLFGLITSHRDGWRVTVAGLARAGTDGRDAVASGLKELEDHGYLVRDRERREDGTLGEAVYAITDLPAHLHDILAGDEARHCARPPQSRRPHPQPGKPAQEAPAQADRTTKNTKNKKTREKNTNPLRPAVRNAHPREDTALSPPPRATDPMPEPDAHEPGVRLLLAIGALYPELLLTGTALHDQGAVVAGLLQTGWSTRQLQHVIAGRPLPQPVRTSVAAITAARLRAAQQIPPPHQVRELAVLNDMPAGDAASHASHPLEQPLEHRVLVECAGCQAPGPARGQDLCPACLGWPFCTSCPGPTPRRAPPGGDGQCTVCAT
ncbi:hypothetical protein ACFVYR_21040 [Streptomyces sp. NPDC058284]|uniref:hypothetical protein n=1 Tax=unclassified Streptomyces TaxID=2593676 RepID=UPI0036643E14